MKHRCQSLKIRNPFLSDHIVNQIRICNPQSFFEYVFSTKKIWKKRRNGIWSRKDCLHEEERREIDHNCRCEKQNRETEVSRRRDSARDIYKEKEGKKYKREKNSLVVLVRYSPNEDLQRDSSMKRRRRVGTLCIHTKDSDHGLIWVLFKV